MEIILLLICLSFGSPVGVITYVQETNLDGNYYENLDGETLLHFTPSESIYIHTSTPKETKILEEGLSFKVIVGDSEGFPIYKSEKERMFHIKTSMPGTGGAGAVVLDTIPHIDWKIQPDDTRQIGKYTCRKAVGIFGGRVYDAWFTPEIPVPHGPYKLGGLPGLILEAHSRDGKVSFHFKSFEWRDESDISIRPSRGKFTFQSWDEHAKKSKEISDRNFLKTKASLPVGSTVTFTIVESSEPVKGDFTIEKKNTP